MLPPKLRYVCASFLLSVAAGFSYPQHGKEVGIGSGLSFLEEEKSWVPAVHVHFVRQLHRKFYTGVSFENIYDEHNHGVLSLVFSYRISNLSLSYMPGFYLYGGSGLNHHLEVSYIFEYRRLHVGPFVSASYGKENHYSAGLHIGFPF